MELILVRLFLFISACVAGGTLAWVLHYIFFTNEQGRSKMVTTIIALTIIIGCVSIAWRLGAFITGATQ